MSRLVGGDQTALGEIFDQFGARCYSLAKRLLLDQALAEDAVQEALLALWRAPERFDAGRGSLATFLLTLTHRRAVDVLRREALQRRGRVCTDDPLSRVPSSEASPPEQVEASLAGAEVRRALTTLPDVQREALLLAYYQGYTQREIASITNTPLGTVKTRMLAGVRALRAQLGSERPSEVETAMTTHLELEALAAGYALHALEPADEQQLAIHLLTCRSCVRLVADTAAVASALAETIPIDSPPTELRGRIVTAATDEPRDVRPNTDDGLWDARERELRARPMVPQSHAHNLRQHGLKQHGLKQHGLKQDRNERSRRLAWRGRVAVTALAAALGVAVAVPVTLAARGSGSGGDPGDTALAQKLLDPGAREITLTGPDAATRAKAVLTDKGALVVASGLPMNDATRSVYVLWAANASGARTPIATFDVRGGHTVQVATTSLPFKAGKVNQVAISYESGRQAPPSPTDVVLSGGTA